MSQGTFGDEPPEKPGGDRESMTFTSLGVTFESAVEDEKDMVRQTEPGEGSMDTNKMKTQLDNKGEMHARLMWRQWMDMLFAHRFEPTPLFDYEVIEKKGIKAPVVRKDTHGHSNRTVFKWSPEVKEQILGSAKSVCMQYAVTSDKEPREVCKEIPFDIFPTEVWRLREFVNEHDVVWTNHDNRKWWDRTPIGETHEIHGVVYMMYTVSNNSPVPRYIGLSRRNDTEGSGLNYSFMNATSESVMTRWGYGKSQHLGELSCTMWEDEYSWSPKNKYQKWADELFVDQSRVLKEPVYLEVLPWLSDSPIIGEENLVMLASRAFEDELLNVEYAERFIDDEQETLV